MTDDELIPMLRSIGAIIDATDPWMGGLCVSPMGSREAIKARKSFHELWKKVRGKGWIESHNDGEFFRPSGDVSDRLARLEAAVAEISQRQRRS